MTTCSTIDKPSSHANSDRRPMFLAPLRVATSALIVFGALALVSAPAAAAEPAVITVTERATTDEVTDLGANGDSAGDILTFANEVFDAANTAKVGDNQGVCTRTVPGVAWDCGWTLTLPSGQIMVQGPFFDGANSVLAIIGGTGQFAGARGDMELLHVTPDDTRYTFTYRLI